MSTQKWVARSSQPQTAATVPINRRWAWYRFILALEPTGRTPKCQEPRRARHPAGASRSGFRCGDRPTLARRIHAGISHKNTFLRDLAIAVVPLRTLVAATR